MNFSPQVIIVLQEQFTAVGAAMSISASAVREAVYACQRASEEAELKEIIAAIAEEMREACDAENGDAARWYWPTKIYTLYDASDCRSVRSVEQKPSSYG